MRTQFFCSYLFLLLTYAHGAKDCIRYHPEPFRETTFACVCSAAECDELPEGLPLEGVETSSAVLYRTSQAGDRLSRSTLNIDSDGGNLAGFPTLTVDHSARYQSIIGFGGAMTDAAAINIFALQKNIDREAFIKQYFGATGIGYRIIRVPMASCDFSTHEYSYADEDGDFDLNTFKLTSEDQMKIFYTKLAMAFNSNANIETKIFGSPWSAPGWMKTTGRMKGGGSLKPDPKYMATWANYFVKFIESYTAAGVPIWAVTTENEPSMGYDLNYPWQAMLITAEDQSIFVRDFLSPAMRKSAPAKDTIIMIFDDFRDHLPDWVDVTLSNATTADLVAGIAVHWYSDASPASNLDATHNNHPNHFILGTEACYTGGVNIGDFSRAMGYAKDIVEDLNHWVTGWVDWNMAVNPQGGPNWVANWVDAPIIVDPEKQLFFKQPMFYAMGQFSKFFLPDGVKIGTSADASVPDGIDHVAVENPDGTTVLAVLNRNEIPSNITRWTEIDHDDAPGSFDQYSHLQYLANPIVRLLSRMEFSDYLQDETIELIKWSLQSKYIADEKKRNEC